MLSCQVICADVLVWAKEYKERIEQGKAEPFHALLSDCPWELSFMQKKWDSTSISFQPETWATLADILHPGAFLMVFAGSRGWHRLACAMEDANLILQPTIFIWLNSQAFPKASRIRKAPKPERERGYRWLGWLGKLGNWLLRKRGDPPKYYLDFIWEGHRYGGQILKDAAVPIICAQVPWKEPRRDCIVKTGAGALNVDAGRISPGSYVPGGGNTQGNYKYGDSGNYSSVRPLVEPHTKGRWPSNFCLIHRAPDPDGSGGCVRAGTRRVKGSRIEKPCDYEGDAGMFGNEGDRPARGIGDPDGYERVDAWRCAEGCPARKLGQMSGITHTHATGSQPQMGSIGYGSNRGKIDFEPYGNDKGTAARYYHQAGWEHERAEMRCARDPETGEPLCVVAKLDEQAGESRSVGGLNPHREPANIMAENENRPYFNYGDEGGRSRYFHQSDWSHEIAERLATEAPVRYNPKAAKKERNNGLDDFYWKKDKASPTGFVRITKDEWEALGEEEKRAKEETGKRVSLRARGNIHPTVKPLSLTKWLASLLSPPKEYAPRRLFVPFAGVASEMCGAILSGGFEEVIGVEMISDYVDIAEARTAFWAGQPVQLKLED